MSITGATKRLKPKNEEILKKGILIILIYLIIALFTISLWFQPFQTIIFLALIIIFGVGLPALAIVLADFVYQMYLK